jgi:hypothetical protein
VFLDQISPRNPLPSLQKKGERVRRCQGEEISTRSVHGPQRISQAPIEGSKGKSWRTNFHRGSQRSSSGKGPHTWTNAHGGTRNLQGSEALLKHTLNVVEPAASSLPKLLPANLISDVGSAESHNRDSGSDPHYYDINEFVNLPSSSDSESGSTSD